MRQVDEVFIKNYLTNDHVEAPGYHRRLSIRESRSGQRGCLGKLSARGFPGRLVCGIGSRLVCAHDAQQGLVLVSVQKDPGVVNRLR
jgi:hypothetical protein